MRKPKIIAVVGPTASGKTALSIALAKRFNGEIVSADSRQIYLGMDIGTAKPTAAERRAVPHHLIDIRDPDEEYTVAEYKRDAIAAITNTLARGRLPILAGGTGLYLRAVLQNLDIPKTAADQKLRRKLEKEVASKGLAILFKKLVALDPDAAHVVDPKNPRRVIRALEVTLATGTPFTAQRRKGAPLFDALMIGLPLSDAALRAHINRRVDRMMHAGLVNETRHLVRRYGAKCRALDAIGYREIIARLGELDHDSRATGVIVRKEIISAIKTDTWRYAKRQMTWFRKDTGIRWVSAAREALPLAEKFIGL